jgi:hypothetical protein
VPLVDTQAAIGVWTVTPIEAAGERNCTLLHAPTHQKRALAKPRTCVRPAKCHSSPPRHHRTLKPPARFTLLFCEAKRAFPPTWRLPECGKRVSKGQNNPPSASAAFEALGCKRLVFLVLARGRMCRLDWLQIDLCTCPFWGHTWLECSGVVVLGARCRSSMSP